MESNINSTFQYAAQTLQEKRRVDFDFDARQTRALNKRQKAPEIRANARFSDFIPKNFALLW